MFFRILLLILFSLSSISLSGQKHFEGGYIVSLKNDTLYGEIKDRKPGIFPKIYKQIRFKEEGLHFRRKYNPDQIVAYRAGERVYESIGIESGVDLLNSRYLITPNLRKNFFRIIQKGELSYYHWEYVDNESNIIDYIPLFHKEGRVEMVRVTQGVFGLKKKLLSEYLSDCPELVHNIERNEVRTAEDVLELYRYFCCEDKY
jgi:hypothetical protein